MKCSSSYLANYRPSRYKLLRELHAYPEETAGALMSSDFVTLAPELSMTEAIETLRDIAGNHDTLYLIYIVDENSICSA